jgi:hypothetical protein
MCAYCGGLTSSSLCVKFRYISGNYDFGILYSSPNGTSLNSVPVQYVPVHKKNTSHRFRVRNG